MAENYLARGESTVFDYCVDMRMIDLNNGEEFFKMDVLVLVPESGYGLFVMNEPVAINKWMVILTPERDGGDEEEDLLTEHKTYAFETIMDCTKIPLDTAVTWTKRAMLRRKAKLIITSRILGCYLSNIFYRDGNSFVLLEKPN